MGIYKIHYKISNKDAKDKATFLLLIQPYHKSVLFLLFSLKNSIRFTWNKVIAKSYKRKGLRKAIVKIKVAVPKQCCFYEVIIMDLTNFFVTFFASSSLAWKLSYFAVIGMYFCRFVDFATALATGPSEILKVLGGQVKEGLLKFY